MKLKPFRYKRQSNTPMGIATYGRDVLHGTLNRLNSTI